MIINLNTEILRVAETMDFPELHDRLILAAAKWLAVPVISSDRAFVGVPGIDVIRRKLKLSKSAFASLMGVSPRTIRNWEQGKRKPQGPAKSLLRIAEQHPEIFTELR